MMVLVYLLNLSSFPDDGPLIKILKETGNETGYIFFPERMRLVHSKVIE